MDSAQQRYGDYTAGDNTNNSNSSTSRKPQDSFAEFTSLGTHQTTVVNAIRHEIQSNAMSGWMQNDAMVTRRSDDNPAISTDAQNDKVNVTTDVGRSDMLSSIQEQSRSMQAELQKFMMLLSTSPSKPPRVNDASDGYELTTVRDDEVSVINDEIRHSIQMLNAMLTANEAASSVKVSDALPHYANNASEDDSATDIDEAPALKTQLPIRKLRIKTNSDFSVCEKVPRAKPAAKKDAGKRSSKPGTKSGESKSGESKSGESKYGESKSGESKSGESKSGEKLAAVKLMYVCSVCDKTFSGKAWLKRHVEKHENDKRVSDARLEQSAMDSVVKQEVVSEDECFDNYNGGLVDCGVTEQGMSNGEVNGEGDVTGHVNGKVKKRRGRIAKVVKDKVEMDTEVKNEEIAEDSVVKSETRTYRVYKCKVCGLEFVRKGLLTHHMMLHGVDKPFKCDLCSRMFRFKSRLIRHKITHTDVKPFQCSECDRTFARKDILKSHMLIHTEKVDKEATNKCEVCSLKFETRDDYRDHMDIHRIHECTLCDKRFIFPCRLQRHMVMHSSDRSFVCDVCDKGFLSQERLGVHMMLHTIDENYRPHLCNHCGKAFARRSSLYQHMLCHTNVRNHVCQVCSMAFVNKCKLRRHEVIHSSVRPFQCDICSSSFKLKTRLHAHKKGHTSERTHVCGTCGKAFMQRQTLRAHMRIHSGIKPCQCGVCLRRFMSRHHLGRHMLTHSGEKPHLCYLCGKSFARKDKLSIHMVVHNGVAPTKTKPSIMNTATARDFQQPDQPAIHPRRSDLDLPPKSPSISTLDKSPSLIPLDHVHMHSNYIPPFMTSTHGILRFGTIRDALVSDPPHYITPSTIDSGALTTDQAIDYSSYHLASPSFKHISDYRPFAT